MPITKSSYSNELAQRNIYIEQLYLKKAIAEAKAKERLKCS